MFFRKRFNITSYVENCAKTLYCMTLLHRSEYKMQTFYTLYYCNSARTFNAIVLQQTKSKLYKRFEIYAQNTYYYNTAYTLRMYVYNVYIRIYPY